MKLPVSFYLLFCFFFGQISIQAQSHNVDSLCIILKTQKEDTNRVKTLNTLAVSLQYTNPDSTIFLAQQAAVLAEKLGWEKGESNAYNIVGVGNDVKGSYPEALDYYLKALKIAEEIVDNQLDARVLGNIGVVYQEQGDYPKALDYDGKALKIAEEIRNKQGQVNTLGNIGNIYYFQGDYTKALDYYMKVLKMDREMGNKGGQEDNLSNIGSVYFVQGDYSKALDYDLKALKMTEEIGNKQGEANTLGNIGIVYTKTGKFKEAENYLKKAIAIDSSIGYQNDLRGLDESISQLYDTTGHYKLALIWYKKATTLKDVLFNIDKDKALTRKELTYQYEKKEAEQERKDAIITEEKKKETLVIYAVSAGLILVLFLAGIILRGYRRKQKDNLLLEEKNRIIEEQKLKVDNAFSELNLKHKEITDSINYAKRIQRALFKDEEFVTLHLPEHYILIKPRDIVSGDFYWGHEKDGHWYIAAVDCTGHGVPGAFLTMLGSTFLNEICSFGPLLTPAEVLNQLRNKIVKELSAHGEVKDGMDISLCRINMKNQEVQWAGANNPLWYIQDNELGEIHADKQPIGYQEGSKQFTNHTIQLKKNDIIYLFTDGYADQFGGLKGKKLKYKFFKETLISIYHLPMKVQKQKLGEVFDEWKGNIEQTDDVLIIGVKV